MRKILLTAAAFIGGCLLGLFCAWIGGIQPFTTDAGMAALFTFFMAESMAGFVGLAQLD